MVLANLLEVYVQTMPKKQKLTNFNWELYEQKKEVLYSYIKKKGKHRRVEDQKTNKR